MTLTDTRHKWRSKPGALRGQVLTAPTGQILHRLRIPINPYRWQAPIFVTRIDDVLVDRYEYSFESGELVLLKFGC